MSEELGITVKKEENFSKWYGEVVQKAELADIRYGVQGFVVHLPWAMYIFNKIYEELEKAVEADGHLPLLLPVVIPDRFFEKEKEHVKGFAPEVFWVTEAGKTKLDEKLALRPTGETAFYSMYHYWIRSHNDLPFKRYQSRIGVYRCESDTRPFLRGREFLFFETHDAFQSHEKAIEQIKKDMKISRDVIDKKFSVPFLYFKRPQWDKFPGAADTYAADSMLPTGKANQIASTHDLGQGFAKSFDITYIDASGKKQCVYQTCFGPGIWRILASIIAIHGDDKGLILPSDIAPIQAVIVPIFAKGNEKEVLKRCKETEKILKENNIRAKFDDRNNTPGFKFNHWELRGVPLRIEIGPKDIQKKEVVLVSRLGTKISVKESDIIENARKMLDDLSKYLEKAAMDYLNKSVQEAKDLGELKDIINKKGGFARAGFCSMDKDGEKCAEFIEKKMLAKVRGTLFDKEEKPDNTDKCIVCGKKATAVTYIARAY